jgi:alpha-D-ribose 1-methylphosphonate 5-triphosphate synthase subunit PhnH
MMALAELRETRFDPLFAGQALFRRLLEATARPGLVVPLGEITLAVPSPRLRPACALLLAVMDREVTFHVLGPGTERLREYLRFNTGAHVNDLDAADFVLVTAPGQRWDRVRRGTLEAPHEGATVVCAPTSVASAPAIADVTLRLQGPGIVGETRLSIQGLHGADLAPLVTRRDFPMGVDVWLAAADGCLAVIPRSTRCREE